MNWKSHAVSHEGNKRKVNQDAYFCHDENGIWAIADGMGGHEAGEIASQTIVQHLANLSQSGRENTDILNITSILEDVNQQIFEQNRALNRTVGSTIAMVLADEGYCTCLWAGDSRIYLYRDKNLTQLTTDHSYVQALIEQGKLSSNDASQHKQRNLITRAVGITSELHVDIKKQDLKSGDKLVICSDGLYDEIDTQEIAAMLEYATAEIATKNLLDVCLSREARDNVSFIIVEID